MTFRHHRQLPGLRPLNIRGRAPVNLKLIRKVKDPPHIRWQSHELLRTNQVFINGAQVVIDRGN